MANADREVSGGQPREAGVTAEAGSLGGPSYFDLAVDICHNSRRQGLLAMHQALTDAESCRLDPPDEPEESPEVYEPCNCKGDRCRC